MVEVDMSSKLPIQGPEEEQLAELLEAYWGDASTTDGARELALPYFKDEHELRSIRAILDNATESLRRGEEKYIASLRSAGFLVENTDEGAAKLQELREAFDHAVAAYQAGAE